MLFIKYAKDKRKLQQLTATDSSFRSLELKAARVINSITGLNLQFTEKERVVDMCQAVQEMCDDARAEGREEGRKEGHTEGKASGRQEQALFTAQRMLKDPRFSPEDISRFSGLAIEEVMNLQKVFFKNILAGYNNINFFFFIFLLYNTSCTCIKTGVGSIIFTRYDCKKMKKEGKFRGLLKYS